MTHSIVRRLMVPAAASLALAAIVFVSLLGMTACAQPPAAQADEPQAKPAEPAAEEGKEPAADEAAKPEITPEGLVKISKKHATWIDTKRKAVVIDGAVCLREGQLEMFACPKGTKEHESVIALDCRPEEVHAGLLAVGAKPGKPVKFDPKYEPATGDIVDVYVLWKDEQGEKHQIRAQEWIQHVKTEKPMPFDFVFSGSGFWTDEETGKKHYQANGGDFICVSNFPTAMLDLPVQSTQANAELMFHAFTKNIPPRGTKVRVVLAPRIKKNGEGAEKPGDKPADEPKTETDGKANGDE